MHDYHVHSNYSDGGFLYAMIAAAERAGLDGVGVADHCNVSERTAPRREKRLLGFTMDTTYGRRREAIRELRDQFDLTVHDAVEMDYDPRDEELIRAFLDEAEFDYAVGSVHHVRDTNVQSAGEWADLDERECRAVVDDHFDALVALVESELFDIAAHVDVLERNPHLRGYATADHYRRVARALAASKTVPEINAGRVLDDYGEFHPTPAFLDALVREGVAVTAGTDAHAPGEIGPRVERLCEELDRRGLEPVEIA